MRHPATLCPGRHRRILASCTHTPDSPRPPALRNERVPPAIHRRGPVVVARPRCRAAPARRGRPGGGAAARPGCAGRSRGTAAGERDPRSDLVARGEARRPPRPSARRPRAAARRRLHHPVPRSPEPDWPAPGGGPRGRGRAGAGAEPRGDRRHADPRRQAPPLSRRRGALTVAASAGYGSRSSGTV